MIGYGGIFGFVCLVLNWKQGPKLRKLSVINQVLASWVNCYRSYYAGSWIVTGDNNLAFCKSNL